MSRVGWKGGLKGCGGSIVVQLQRSEGVGVETPFSTWEGKAQEVTAVGDERPLVIAAVCLVLKWYWLTGYSWEGQVGEEVGAIWG